MLVDPSYEVKADYTEIPAFFQDIARKWNVGTLMLWYPILTDDRQRGMVARLTRTFPEALNSQVFFPLPDPVTAWSGQACSWSIRPGAWPRKPPGSRRFSGTAP